MLIYSKEFSFGLQNFVDGETKDKLNTKNWRECWNLIDKYAKIKHTKYSYSSMLEWYSYEKWFDGEADMEERINMDMIGDLYGSAATI